MEKVRTSSAIWHAVPIVLTAFVLWTSSAPAAEKKTTVILTTALREILYANISSVPLHLGYFADEGLTVNFANVPGGAVGAQLVAGGKGDMYFGSVDQVFKVRPLGGTLKIVYVMNQGRQYYPVVLENSPIKEIAHLKGKRIGVLSLAMGGIPYYKAILAEGGLNPERDVTFIAVGQGAQALAALTKGAVDALALWDTEIATIENMGYRFRKFLPSADPSGAGVSSSIVTTDAYIKSSPDVIKSYLRAIAKATVFCLHNEAACAQIHWAVYPESRPQDAGTPEGLQKALHVLRTRYQLYEIKRFPDISQWGGSTDERFKRYTELLLSSGQLQAVRPVSEYFTREFLDYANGFDAGKIQAEARNYKLESR